jgi:hypothetical protein
MVLENTATWVRNIPAPRYRYLQANQENHPLCPKFGSILCRKPAGSGVVYIVNAVKGISGYEDDGARQFQSQQKSNRSFSPKQSWGQNCGHIVIETQGATIITGEFPTHEPHYKVQGYPSKREYETQERGNRNALIAATPPRIDLKGVDP